MSRVYIIAEAGVNHNGEADHAVALVDAAVTAGADAVKFQTFVPEALVSRDTPKAGYQRRNTGSGESQLEMLRRLALAPVDYGRLQARCRERGIDFLSSPFDAASADLLLQRLELPLIKLGSGELTNAPLLLQIARSGRRLILSTGMSDLAEVEEALGVLAFGYLGAPGRPGAGAFRSSWERAEARAVLRDKVILLHCTTEYPCPFAEANLLAVETLRDRFGLKVGFSDHTLGWAVAVAAAARGATVIEKHFTLDRTLPGPDHRASLEPDELAAMVTAIRQVELALGDGAKRPTPSERQNRAIARKCVVTSRPIARGEPFTTENLTTRRAGEGLDAMRYFDLLGTPAGRDYQEDERIDP